MPFGGHTETVSLSDISADALRRYMDSLALSAGGMPLTVLVSAPDKVNELDEGLHSAVA